MFRSSKLLHYARGVPLTTCWRNFVSFEALAWLDTNAADGTAPPSDDPSDPRVIRHLNWRRHRLPAEQWMVKLLRSGELLATGYELPIGLTAKRQNIPRDFWEFLQPNFFDASAEGEGIRIVRIEIMETPAPGSVPYVPPKDRTPEQLVEVADDGSMLKINSERFLFRGVMQQRVIRRLYDGYLTGVPEKTQLILAKCSTNCDSIAQVFRGYRNWEQLHCHIKQDNGFCWLEPCFR